MLIFGDLHKGQVGHSPLALAVTPWREWPHCWLNPEYELLFTPKGERAMPRDGFSIFSGHSPLALLILGG